MEVSLHLKHQSKQFGVFLEFIRGQAPRICQRQIQHRYINTSSLKNADGILVASEALTRTRSKQLHQLVNGFAIFQILGDSIYLDVICARTSGKILLNEIYKVAKMLGKTYVKLNALPHVINFYKKEGFVHSENNCVSIDKITQLSNSLSSLRFKTQSQALKNKEFFKLLQLLKQNKLVANKSCRSVKDCSIDGYTMVKCI